MDESKEIEDPKVGDRLDQLSLRAFRGLPVGTEAVYEEYTFLYTGGGAWAGSVRLAPNQTTDQSSGVFFWMSRITTLPAMS